MFVRRRLAAALAVLTAALAIGVQVASASAATTHGLPPLPGPIEPPNAQCPIWRGLNIIPIGCVPWFVIFENHLVHPNPWIP